MKTSLKSNFPIGWHLYAVLTVASSLLIPLGLHRKFYFLLNELSVPSLVVAALTGLVNLSWYELAYIVGGGLRSVLVFTLLPFVGSATGLLSVLLLYTGVRWRRQLLFTHLAFGLMVSSLALAGLLWRGAEDSWRLVTITAFLLTYVVWVFYFLRTRIHFSRV